MLAWNQLLPPVTDAGIDAVLEEAKLDWEVDTIPMYLDLTDEMGQEHMVVVDNHK